jgi:hypothetical protein
MQVWHYLGTDKSEGVSAIATASPQGADSSTVSEGSTSQPLDVPMSDLDQESVEYPLDTPSRLGKMFSGTIKRFDSWAQAHFIEFDDEDRGWYQLWRDDELFEIL